MLTVEQTRVQRQHIDRQLTRTKTRNGEMDSSAMDPTEYGTTTARVADVHERKLGQMATVSRHDIKSAYNATQICCKLIALVHKTDITTVLTHMMVSKKLPMMLMLTTTLINRRRMHARIPQNDRLMQKSHCEQQAHCDSPVTLIKAETKRLTM